jgi:nuclear GTP-binding protein
MIKYKIAKYASAQEFLSHIARRRGKLLKGGIPDYQDAARIVLQDWNSGNISYFTVPPEIKSQTSHDSSCIVSEFSKEFDIGKLLEEADQNDVSILPSILSVGKDSLIEMTTGECLDELFLRMAISENHDEPIESKNEESESSDIDEVDQIEMNEEDEEDISEDNDEMNDETTSSVPHVKNPIRADNEYNPQVNQQRKKQLKKQRKLQKKLKAYSNESFDFKTDFIADTDIAEGEADDDDLLNI